MRKLLTYSLLLVLLQFQYQIWFGSSSLGALNTLQANVDEQRASNDRLRARNEALEIEVKDLKIGSEAVEERARSELGMIGKDEIFYQFVD